MNNHNLVFECVLTDFSCPKNNLPNQNVKSLLTMVMKYLQEGTLLVMNG